MENIDEDTEWNAILREKGILPPKNVEPPEELPPPPDPETKLNNLSIHQLDSKIESVADENGDEEEMAFLEQYRRKRLAALQQEAALAKFGSVGQVTKADWQHSVNDVVDAYVVIHISRAGHLQCKMVDSYLSSLARKFPAVKFLRGEASLCIPNYPDSNLPSILIYHNGELEHQLIGLASLGGKHLSAAALEWRLAEFGVCKTELTEDPARHAARSAISTGHGRIEHRSDAHEDCSDSE